MFITLQAVEQQINKENIPLDAANTTTTPKVTTPRVLSPRSSIDTVILPERIRIPSGGSVESRKSLDFSDRGESDSERSITSSASATAAAGKVKNKSDASSVRNQQPPHHSSTAAQPSPSTTTFTRRPSTENIKGDSSVVGVLTTTTSSSILKEVSDELSKSSFSSSPSTTNNSRKDKVSTAELRSTKLSNKQSGSVHNSLKDTSRQDSIEEVSDISLGKDLSDKSSGASSARTTKSKNFNEDNTATSRHSEKVEDDDNDYKYDSDSFETSSSKSGDASLRSKSASLSSKISSSRSVVSDPPSASKDRVAYPSSPTDHGNSNKSVSEVISELVASSSASLMPDVLSQKEEDKLNKDNLFHKLDAEHSNKYSTTSNKFENDTSVRSEVSEKSQEPSISEQLASLRSGDDKSMAATTRSLSKQDDKITVEGTPEHHSIKSSRSSKNSSSISTTVTSSQSNFIEPDNFSKSNVSSAHGFRVGERVTAEGSLMGTIRYLGKTSFSPVVVAGVELDEPLGTNDGRFHERQYFTCAPNHGFFTTMERLQHHKNNQDTTLAAANSTISGGDFVKISDNDFGDVLLKKDEHEGSPSVTSSTSTIEEVDDISDLTSLKLVNDDDGGDDGDEDKLIGKASSVLDVEVTPNSYSEHFEPTSKPATTAPTFDDDNKLPSSITLKETATTKSVDEHKTHSSSSTSSSIISEHISEKTINKSENDVLSNNKSDDSISVDDEVEVPSPRKVDIDGLTDRITDGILKSIVVESLQNLYKDVDDTTTKDRSIIDNNDISSPSDKPESTKSVSIEQDVSSTQQRDSVSTPAIAVETAPVVVANDVNNVTKNLLNDAISVMLGVAREKNKKLSEDVELQLQKQQTQNKKDTRKLDFLSLIVPDPDDPVMISDANDEDEDDNDKENDHLLSEKINQLKNVHDQLDMLLGDNDDEDDEIINSVGMETSKSALSLREEEPLRIPLNDNDTRAIVSLALQEISGERNLSVDQLERLIVPDSILALETYGEVDEPSTMLYKTLIFDLTLQLYCESKEFRQLQAKPRPSWLKRPRKTFSKFTRQVHLEEVQTFPDLVSNYVCSCIGLQSGRPSLVQLKRKLPLNLEKKDYVDAVLVDELRQEEGQWVNYDEDELRVKFQLADNILESLLEETVEILNRILNKS